MLIEANVTNCRKQITTWIKTWQDDPHEITKVSTSCGRLVFGTFLQMSQRTPIPRPDHRPARGRRWPCLCCAPTARNLCMYTVVRTNKGADLSEWHVPTTISMSTLPEKPWHPLGCHTRSLVGDGAVVSVTKSEMPACFVSVWPCVLPLQVLGYVLYLYNCSFSNKIKTKV